MYKFCKQEKENGLQMSLGKCLERTASMTGVSLATIKRYIAADDYSQPGTPMETDN